MAALYVVIELLILCSVYNRAGFFTCLLSEAKVDSAIARFSVSLDVGRSATIRSREAIGYFPRQERDLLFCISPNRGWKSALRNASAHDVT